jgi:hypothetical protein
MNEIKPVGDGAGLITSVPPARRRTVPDRFELYQNFPNPFNPSTTFRFYLPAEADLTITICDVAGAKTETLVEGRISQGLHEHRWTPRGLASGVYFCVMRAGSSVETRKMIYQK